jgi:hypothetical protein
MNNKTYDYILEGLTDRAPKWTQWGYGTVFIVLLGSILYSLGQFTPLGVNKELLENGGDIFLKYIFLVVVVERAAAVFVEIFRSQNKVDWTLRINRINEILKMESPPTAILEQVHTREKRLIDKLVENEEIGKITDVASINPTQNDYLGYLTSAKHAYEWQRARFDSVSIRHVARIVLFAGIVLAALGLSIFHDLFVLDSDSLAQGGFTLQIGLLRFADIVVTGGFLGGGSAGLNAATTKLSEFLNKP